MSDHTPQGQYWNLDVPGLVESQADELLAMVQDKYPSLHGITVDPAQFMTIHMDRKSALTLLDGLTRVPKNDVSTGLIEIIEEWLSQV